MRASYRSGYNNPQVRFWARVDKNGPIHPVHGQCWVWIGSKFEKGYGQLTVNGKNTKAHRYSYTLNVGPIPEGLQVLHRCDNPSCVKPEHLFVGTQLDNAKDMVSKGRGRSRWMNVTTRQKHAVKKRYCKGSKTNGSYALAEELGVSQTAIWFILGIRRRKQS